MKEFGQMIGVGIMCVARGDIEGAHRWLRQATRTTDPRQLTDLGAIYQLRLKDLERAEECYRRAADGGSVMAMNNLGVLLKQRDELDEAEHWLRRAAETGDADAWNNLGNVLERRGDWETAIEHHRMAARLGHPAAMCTLALHLAHYDHNEAVTWFHAARATGDPSIEPQLRVLDGLLRQSAPAREPTDTGMSDNPIDKRSSGDPITVDVDDPLASAESARASYLRSGEAWQLDFAVDMAQHAERQAGRSGDQHLRCLALLGALLRLRYERDRDPESLAEAEHHGRAALDDALPTDSGYPFTLSQLGTTVVSLGQLDEALELHREAMACLEPDDPRFPELKSGLANALLAHFDEHNDPVELDEAVLAYRSAIQATAPDDPELAIRQFALASALLTRFARDNAMVELNEARELLDQAYQSLPETHGLRQDVQAAITQAAEHAQRHGSDNYERTGNLSVLLPAIDQLRVTNDHLGLGVALRALYERLGDPSALDEAADQLAVVADKLPSGVVLADVLRLRALHTGDDDLRRALEVGREVSRRTSADDPERSERLRTLAAIVLQLGIRTQDSSALREAVDLYRAALTEAVGTTWARTAAELSTALLIMHRNAVDPHDFDEAVQLAQDAVDSTGPAHPRRAQFEAVAATARFTRALTEDDDLNLAAKAARSAAATTPGGHPERPDRLAVLCRILFSRYLHDPQPEALNEAIREAETWATVTPPWHLQWSDAQAHLADLLALRAIHSRDDAEMVTSALRLRQIAQNEDIAATDRVRAAARWARTCLVLGDFRTALQAYELAVDLLPRTARRALQRDDRERYLGTFAGLASEAAGCALEVGQPLLALRLLEHGRGVLLDQALSIRADLTALRERRADLAEEFFRLNDELDPDPLLGELAVGIVRGRLDAPLAFAAQRRRDLASRFDELVAEVRRIAGFERFLARPTADELMERSAGRSCVVLTVSGWRCDAIILADRSVTPIRLPNLDQLTIEKAATEFRKAIKATRHGPASTRLEAQHAVINSLNWLWDNIAEPVLKHVTANRVWWVPTGPFVEFPLHAAGKPDGPGVSDRVISSYLPTIRSLPPSDTHRRCPMPKVLIVAMHRTPSANDLPRVRDEIQQLPPSTALTNEAATRRAVLDALPQHSWVHFACHVTGLPNIRLLLHDHESRPLSIADIATLRLRDADLAYLSACETTRAPVELADEAMHITGAFYMAGFKHVIGTLWPVNDSVATTISANFYAALRNGAPDAAHALHAATAALRDTFPKTPSRWASHIHVGQ